MVLNFCLMYVGQGFPTWGTRPPRGTQEVVKGDASVKKMDRNCNIWHKNGNFECVFCEYQKYVFWVASTNDIIKNSYIKSPFGLLSGAQHLLGGRNIWYFSFRETANVKGWEPLH